MCVCGGDGIIFHKDTVVTSQEVLWRRRQLCSEEQLLGSSLVPHAGALARMWLMTSWLLRSPHKQPKPPVTLWILFLLSALIPALLAMCSGLFSVQFSSVQFSRSVVSDSLRPHGLRHARPPCPSPTPGVHEPKPHVHRVSDAIQPSQPLSSLSPPAFNLSQHQSLFKWVSSSHQVAKGLF